MSAPSRHGAFDTAHPAVPALYLAVTLGLTMFGMQPALIGISLLGALAVGARADGPAPTLMALRWQLPLIVVIAVLNPLFSASGSTEVLRLGTRAIYLESLWYGLSMGGLFMASLLWFRAAARLLPSDRVMALLGNVAPTAAFMVSMCMRLMPRFLRQGRQILGVQEVGMPAAARRSEVARARLRASSVLMGWTMEDSLECADAMRARGWETAGRRTSYECFRFRGSDALACLAILTGGALCCLLAWAATSQYAYYPRASELVAWWGYAPYAAWMLVPTVLQVVEERRFS